MAEPDRNGISARLWRVPGQLLLALINATAILVIVAAIPALVAMARINHFAENVAATMTEAVLAKVDLPPKGALANLQNLTVEVRALGNTLREIKAGEHPALQSEIEQLKEALTVLNISVDRLGSARSILTDEAIEQLGRTVTDALMKLRDCSSGARQAEPRRPLVNRTVEAWEEHAPVKFRLHQRRSEFSSAATLKSFVSEASPRTVRSSCADACPERDIWPLEARLFDPAQLA